MDPRDTTGKKDYWNIVEDTTTQHVGNHYTKTNTHNINNAWVLLQTTGGNHELNIVFNTGIVTENTIRNVDIQEDKMYNTNPTSENNGLTEGTYNIVDNVHNKNTTEN